jgi:hypothetical protein
MTPKEVMNFAKEQKTQMVELPPEELAYKRTKEVDPVRLRPHPYEFVLYFDI